ncbi:MAG: hypothetical protein L0220_18210 [Acidobacteria bacterium]|nr:hypothetical protein [Acidobacteriota bacterium]
MSDRLEGVALKSLKPCDTIHARTLNSDYEIFLLDPESGSALVRGGKYFAEPREAILSGSNFGGSSIKLGWIGLGLRMELSINGHNIATSPVEELRVEYGNLSVDNLVVDSSVSQ